MRTCTLTTNPIFFFLQSADNFIYLAVSVSVAVSAEIMARVAKIEVINDSVNGYCQQQIPHRKEQLQTKYPQKINVWTRIL